MADRFQISKVNGSANVNAAFDEETGGGGGGSAANAEQPSNGPAAIGADASGHAHENHLQPKTAEGGESRRTSRLSFRGFGQFLRKSDAERKFSLAQLTKWVTQQQ